MKKVLFSLLILFMFIIKVNAADIFIGTDNDSVAIGDNIVVTVTVNGEDADVWNYCLNFSGPVKAIGDNCVVAGGIINGRSTTFNYKSTGSGVVTFSLASYEVLNYKAESSNTTSNSSKVFVYPQVDDKDLIPVYRMFNPKNGEHLYTTDTYEVEVLYKKQGWGKEGIAWYTTKDIGFPVYRLFNPKLGNHLYTSDEHEIDVITKTQGWVLDFDGEPVMYSSGSVPIYRLFNPDLKGQHHLTTDENEYNVLPKRGWRQEGKGINAYASGVPEKTNYYRKK